MDNIFLRNGGYFVRYYDLLGFVELQIGGLMIIVDRLLIILFEKKFDYYINQLLGELVFFKIFLIYYII